MSSRKLSETGIDIFTAVDELLEAHAQDESIPALHGFCNAVRNRKDIHIKTPNGDDVTENYKAALQEAVPLPRQSTGAEVPFRLTGLLKSRVNTLRSDNDQKLSFVRRETDLSSKPSRTSTIASSVSRSTEDTDMTELDDFEDDKRAPLLVTDDRKLRIQASSFGTAAIATYMMKRWLDQTRRNSTEFPSDTTPMEIDPPTGVTASTE